MAYKQPYIPKGLNPGQDYVYLVNEALRLDNMLREYDARMKEIQARAQEFELEQAMEAAKQMDYLDEREISPQLRPEAVGREGGIRDYIQSQRKAGKPLKFTNVPGTAGADPDYFYYQEGGPSDRAKGLKAQLAEQKEIEKYKAGWRPEKPEKPPKPEIIETDDGYIAVHPVTGKPIGQTTREILRDEKGDPRIDPMTGEYVYGPPVWTSSAPEPRQARGGRADPASFRGAPGVDKLFQDLVSQSRQGGQQAPPAQAVPLMASHGAQGVQGQTRQQPGGLMNMLTQPIVDAGKQFFQAMETPPEPPPPRRGSYTQGPSGKERDLAMQELAGAARGLGFYWDNPYAPWNLAQDAWGGLEWGGDKIIEALRYLADQQSQARRQLPAYTD